MKTSADRRAARTEELPRVGDLGKARSVRTDIGEIVCHVRGSGRVVVLVHGIFANADLWAEVVDRLAPSFCCVCVDLPLGAHAVPAGRAANLTPESVAAALGQVIESVAPSGAVLVANDTGGVLAQLVMTSRPELLDAVVLTSCDAFSNFLPWSLRYTQVLARIPGGVWLMLQLLRSPLVRRLPIAFGWLTAKPVDPELWRSFLTPGLRDPAVRRDLAAFLASISTRYTRQAARELGRFRRPVLLPWADTQRVFPISHANKLASLLPDAEVVPVRNSRAFVPLDQPAVLAGLVEEFLTRHPAETTRPTGMGPAEVPQGEPHA